VVPRSSKSRCQLVSYIASYPVVPVAGTFDVGDFYVINHSDNEAVDNIIIKCVDDRPSDDRADNCSISSRHQVIGKRRCRTVNTATNKCKLLHF